MPRCRLRSAHSSILIALAMMSACVPKPTDFGRSCSLVDDDCPPAMQCVLSGETSHCVPLIVNDDSGVVHEDTVTTDGGVDGGEETAADGDGGNETQVDGGSETQIDIDGGDNTAVEVPEEWTCSDGLYGSGGPCDCGCGVLDSDCSASAATACETEHCGASESVHDDENWRCEAEIIDAGEDDAGQPDLEGWTCDALYYDDGVNCECGCGKLDPDCVDASAAVCDFNWCNGGGTAAPAENWLCVYEGEVPEAWTCNDGSYNSGQDCDCGCGTFDADCANSSASSCDINNCPQGQSVDQETNWLCDSPGGVPDGWTCAEGVYLDGQWCDCGCGVQDLDCGLTTEAECDISHCTDGKTVDLGQNWLCVGGDGPDVPAGWSCAAGAYDDGATCDCGCGAADPDCADNRSSNCDVSHCGPGREPDPVSSWECNTTRTGGEWTCQDSYYNEGNSDFCDCGCGIQDPDCESASASFCDYEHCATGSVDVDENWKCTGDDCTVSSASCSETGNDIELTCVGGGVSILPCAPWPPSNDSGYQLATCIEATFERTYQGSPSGTVTTAFCGAASVGDECKLAEDFISIRCADGLACELDAYAPGSFPGYNGIRGTCVEDTAQTELDCSTWDSSPSLITKKGVCEDSATLLQCGPSDAWYQMQTGPILNDLGHIVDTTEYLFSSTPWRFDCDAISAGATCQGDTCVAQGAGSLCGRAVDCPEGLACNSLSGFCQ